MTNKRRTLLKGTLATTALGAAAATGLIAPRLTLAAWPKDAFKADNAGDVVSRLFGTADHTASSDIKVKAPDIAENGAVVPITVSTSLPNIETIAIIAEKNPAPLAASFDLGGSSKGYVSTRIKMGKTSNVVAVVKSDGKLYSASKEVKVTIGGCGG